MKTNLKVSGLALVVAATLMAGCSTPKLSDSIYRANEVGVAKSTERCRVLAVREISIRQDQDKNYGGPVGAILGGTLGQDIGGGTGRALATQVGAILGAIAGDKAADRIAQQNGLEYTVITSKGDEHTFAQNFVEGDRVVNQGENCLMQTSAGGFNRVLPAENLPSEIMAPRKTKLLNF